MRKAWLRWLPAAVVPAVVVAGAIAIPAVADTSPTLPEKSAEQVLELISDSIGVAYSGTIEQRAELGLPELPSAGNGPDSPAATALELLSGSHTARVFVDGEGALRVQVMDELAERDVVRNGNDVWLYDSRKKEATHLTLPATPSSLENGADVPAPSPGAARTPAEVAERLLATIDPSTSVRVGDTARVAGRSVYELLLTPRTTDTLVGSVALSVDSETGLPLRVVVAARGQEAAAFSVGFSAIDFTTPATSLFEFSPPADATVTEKTLAAPSDHDSTGAHADGARPTVIGDGWGAVVALPAGVLGKAGAIGSTTGAPTGDAGELLDQLTTPVDGGRVLQTALLSVLVTDDGRVFAGAVPADRLQAVAALP